MVQWVRKLIPTRNANPDLKWEMKEEVNIGLDFDLFGGRVSGAFDFYNRLTKDALWITVFLPLHIYMEQSQPMLVGSRIRASKR